MELNKEQSSCALHAQGPLLIIAGAGTGKTRVITSRILNLLQNGRAKSSEILALTFTEKATNEMIERIDESMPIGYEELNVQTFHAFAQQILRESGMEIGLDPGFKIFSPVEQWFFVKKHLFDFELDYYRPLGNPNKFIYAMLSHFGRLKEELISAEDYLSYSLKNLEEVSQDLENASEVLEEAQKLLEMAKAYKKYQDLCVANNYMDFADLCFYADKLLKTRPSVLKKYRERFKYILVDEFQDTNYAQFQMVLHLALGHKNICVVGDDDQSIYKWRGASLSNILQFEEYFPGAKKVVLTENYRSTQQILDGAYELVKNNNPDRLEVKAGISKELKSFSGDGEPIEVHRFKNFLQETGFVAESIKSLKSAQNLSFSDFAILIRANQLSAPFIDELKYAGIPYQVRNPKGMLILDEIKELVAVTKVLSNPNDDVAMLRVLKNPAFGLEMSEVLGLLNEDKNEHLYKTLEKKSLGDDCLPGMESGAMKVFALVKELIEISKTKSAGQVINHFLDKSGYLKFLIDSENYEAMENINEFAKQVSKFERDSEERSIRDFNDYLSLMEEAGGVMDVSIGPDKDCVQILTVHGSKGLEFEYVFVVNAVNERFPGRRRSEQFAIPEVLTKEIYPDGDFYLQEERRLFYVAMTRAKRKLFITLSEQYEGNKKWKISRFASEVLECKSAKLLEHEEDEDSIKKLSEFKQAAKPIFELPKFKVGRLSYSQFDTFKTCPLKYSYRYMMNVPSIMGHAGNFGLSVHTALNEIYRLIKSGEEMSLETMLEVYERNWISYGYESREHELERKKQGVEIFKEFYAKNSGPWIVPAYLEQPFNLRIGEVLINGRIDRIDKLADGSYEVIDYKTGQLKEGKDITKDLQLSIYALACRDILKIPVSRLSLYYLEDNEKISTSRNSDQLEKVGSEIIDLVEEMKKSDFAPTPGFHCQYCDFRLICPAA